MGLVIVLQDKTFGLKNKKGAKQQRFIQQVEKQIKSGGVPPRKLEDQTKKKDEKLKDAKELSLIFKPVQTQKIEKGFFRFIIVVSILESDHFNFIGSC